MANFTVTANIESAKPSSSRSDIHSMMVENHKKVSFYNIVSEASYLRLHFEWTKFSLKRQKNGQFSHFDRLKLPPK